MKKLILSALLLTATVTAFGQGQIIFQNSSTTGITNGATGVGALGTAADQTDTQVGLYIGLVGDPASSLTLIAQTNCNNPGRFAGGTLTLNGWTGTVQFQVRAWLASTVYPSYEAAVAGAFGGDGSVLIGASPIFTAALTIAPATPNTLPTVGLQRFNINPVPEPSSIALGLLGLGAVALFRRRK